MKKKWQCGGIGSAGKPSREWGVVWRGNPIPDRGRSIEFELFRRLFNPHFEFISLQKEVTDTEARPGWNRAGVLHTGDALADFSDTAALCVLMDFVISVDTSVRSSGRCTWGPRLGYCLPGPPIGAGCSIGTTALGILQCGCFRQKASRDWNGVLERLELELTKRSSRPGISV